MKVLAALYPDWRELTIHESSPGFGGVSLKAKRECRNYIASQYVPEMPFGTRHPDGYLNENLEQQTLPDDSCDIVITQDVFEHIFHPDLAIKEIVRTLKPGGSHIMSVPIVNKNRPTQRRAALVDGKVEHLAEEQYHGNPVGDGKSLVTVDWGYDIAPFLAAHSGYPTTIYWIDDMSAGIRAEYIEILVTTKASRHPPSI